MTKLSEIHNEQLKELEYHYNKIAEINKKFIELPISAIQDCIENSGKNDDDNTNLFRDVYKTKEEKVAETINLIRTIEVLNKQKFININNKGIESINESFNSNVIENLWNQQNMDLIVEYFDIHKNSLSTEQYSMEIENLKKELESIDSLIAVNSELPEYLELIENRKIVISEIEALQDKIHAIIYLQFLNIDSEYKPSISKK